MKLSKTTLAAYLGAFLIASSSVAVVFAKSDKEEGQDVASSDCKLEKYTDPEVFAATMANPAKFMEMMALMSDPQSAPKMMECSMKPEQWSVWMTRMSDPSKLMAIMTQFMNPQMYTNWMAASMNPQTYQPMYAFMNPGLYTQWITVAMNPESYTPMFEMMDPKWQQESATSMMNPNFFQQMFEGFYQPTAVADATSAE